MIEVCTMADAKGAAEQISLRLPAAALEAVDRARLEGLFPRSRSEWVRDAIAAYLVAPATAHGRK